MSSEKEQQQKSKSRKQQIIDEFDNFVEERNAFGDWGNYVAPSGDKLNRSELANELGFARSVWGSNDDLKDKLLEEEEKLRGKGILRPIKEKDSRAIIAESDRKERSLGQSQSRVKSLEQQLAAVTAERDDLKRRLDRLEFLEHHMAMNGRVPH